jgi:PKD domain
MKHVTRFLSSLSIAGVVLFLVLISAASAVAQTWIELAPVGTPPEPPGACPKHVNYDAAKNRLIVFYPGIPGYGGFGNQVWVLTNANGLGGNPEWINLAPTGTPPVSNGMESVTYDSVSNRLTVFGGCAYNCSPSLHQVIVLVNANGLGGQASWVQSTVTNPQQRSGHTAVYDPTSNRMIVFGGDLAFYGTAQNDTKILTNANGVPSPSAWSTLVTAGGPPVARNAHSAVYDEANGRMIIFGGNELRKDYCCGFSYGNMDYTRDDVWVLSNANGIAGVPTWTQLSPSGPTPPSRSSHSAVYDSANNRMLVFGGSHIADYNSQTHIALGDLWEIRYANGSGGTPIWTELSPAGTPPGPRTAHTAAFDSEHQRMILLGGRDVNGVPSNRVWVLVFNQQPLANAGPDQTVECAEPAGTLVTLDASGSSDPEGDALNYTWTGPFGAATGASPTVNQPYGTSTVTLVVNDGTEDSTPDTVNITVHDTTAPTLTLSNNSATVVLPTAGATTASVDVLAASGASATDVCCDSGVTLSPAGSPDYPVGTTTAYITASDGNSNTSAGKPFTVNVVYNFSGFLPPIRVDGSSIFRSGRTIPVKIQLTATDGSIVSDATASLLVAQVSGNVIGSFEEITPEAAGNSNLDSLFRFDPTSGQYIYNLQAKGFPTGTYVLRVHLNDGTNHDVYVSVR